MIHAHKRVTGENNAGLPRLFCVLLSSIPQWLENCRKTFGDKDGCQQLSTHTQVRMTGFSAAGPQVLRIPTSRREVQLSLCDSGSVVVCWSFCSGVSMLLVELLTHSVSAWPKPTPCFRLMSIHRVRRILLPLLAVPHLLCPLSSLSSGVCFCSRKLRERTAFTCCSSPCQVAVSPLPCLKPN